MKKIILFIAIFFVSISYGQLKQVKGNTFTSSANKLLTDTSKVIKILDTSFIIILKKFVNTLF